MAARGELGCLGLDALEDEGPESESLFVRPDEVFRREWPSLRALCGLVGP